MEAAAGNVPENKSPTFLVDVLYLGKLKFLREFLFWTCGIAAFFDLKTNFKKL